MLNVVKKHKRFTEECQVSTGKCGVTTNVGKSAFCNHPSKD